MQTYLSNMIYVLEALGYDLFSVHERTSASPSSARPLEDDITDGHDLSLNLYSTLPRRLEDRAFLQYVNGAYTLMSGSKINARITDSLPANVRKLRQQLIDDGELVGRGEYLELMRDIPFSKPSPASALVKGRSSTGYMDWVRKTDNMPLGTILGIAASGTLSDDPAQ